MNIIIRLTLSGSSRNHNVLYCSLNKSASETPQTEYALYGYSILNIMGNKQRLIVPHRSSGSLLTFDILSE